MGNYHEFWVDWNFRIITETSNLYMSFGPGPFPANYYYKAGPHRSASPQPVVVSLRNKEGKNIALSDIFLLRLSLEPAKTWLVFLFYLFGSGSVIVWLIFIDKEGGFKLRV